MNLLRKTETYIYADRDLLVHNIEEAVVEVLWTLDGSNYMVPEASHPVCPITHQVEELGQSGREWGKLWTKDIFASGKIGINEIAPADLFEMHADGLCNIAIFRYSNDTASANLRQNKARGTKASPVVPNSGDQIGVQTFRVWDGAAWQISASVRGSVDGAVAAGDAPGRLTFWTTPAGSVTAAEVMRITAAKNIGFNKTTFGTNLAKGICWGSGTDPTSQPADAIQALVLDYAAGDARLKIWGETGNPAWVGNGHLLTDNLVNDAKGKLIESIYHVLYHQLAEGKCLGKAGLAEGTNAATIKFTNAFDYEIDGILYRKNATDNIAMDAQPEQLGDTHCLYLISIDSLGNVYTTYTWAAPLPGGIPALPPLHPDRAPVGYISVIPDTGVSFTSGTDDLSMAGLTVAYYDLRKMPYGQENFKDKIGGLWVFDAIGTSLAVFGRTAHGQGYDGQYIILDQEADTMSPAVRGLCPYLNTAGSKTWNKATGNTDNSIMGNSLNDFPISFILLLSPNAQSGEILSSYSLEAVFMQVFRIFWSSNQIQFRCYDYSAGGYRGRRTDALSDVGSWVTYIVTYSGSGNPLTGAKIYRNGVRVDTTDLTSGAYTAMENICTVMGNYYYDAAANKTGIHSAKYGILAAVGDDLSRDARTIPLLDNILRAYANDNLN